VRRTTWTACVTAVLLGLTMTAPGAQAHEDPPGPGSMSAEQHARQDLADLSMSTIEQETAAAAAARPPRVTRADVRGLARARTEAAPASPEARGRSGSWSRVVRTPVVPVFQAVLPNGKVLMWDSVGDGAVDDFPGAQDYTRAVVWDPARNTSQDVRLEGYNIFCAGYTQLPGGDVLVVGGNKNAQTEGIRQTHVFHWRTQTWSRGPDMDAERWYPSVAALADGEAVIVGGGSPTAEVYQRDGSLRSLDGISTYYDRVYYPMLVPREDGRLELVGPGPMTTIDTLGQGFLGDAADLDPVFRSYGSYATFKPGQTLVTGGGDVSSPDGTRAPSDSSIVVDTTGDGRSVKQVAAMAEPRRQHNLTVLADGSVLATGGTDRSEDGYVDLEHPVLAAERWDPSADRWTTLAAAARIRQYHSSASLLPDGRVLTGGGGVCSACVRAGYLEKNVEYFSPPYLFTEDGEPATRPVLRDAPRAVRVGESFTLDSPQASTIRSLALVRLGAPTHGIDHGQRYVPLAFTASGSRLSVRAPATSGEAPPGYYMLFAVDGAGVPSVASMVQVRGDLAAPTVNLALGQAATQSSTFDEADGSATGSAPHAVDGDTDGTWRNPADTVTHTALRGDDDPWWQVALGQDSVVDEVELWNRTDCCRERLGGSLFLASEDMSSRTYTELRADPAVTEVPFTPGVRPNISVRVPPTTARFVRVQLVGVSPLHMAEVEVLGHRVPGTDDVPVALAAPSGSGPARAGREARLDGTASNDPEGGPVSYRWTQVAGPAVRLSDDTAARPSFVVPRRGGSRLRFSLVVTDAGGQASVPGLLDVAIEPVVNLARGRPTRQSSTVGGGRPARAVDGRTDGRWSRGSVTRTAEQARPWWQVDLGGVREIDSVRVWSRSDCCARQLRGARVLMSERSMVGRSWAELTSDPTVVARRLPAAKTSSVPGARARYVRVQSPRRRVSLALAEVQVLGWRR